MDLSKNRVDDTVLVSRAKAGDKEALDELIARYFDKISLKAATFKNVNGIDADDLCQEGMLGFISAVYSFDEGRNVQFYTYASTLAVRRMISAIRKVNNNANLPLQSYVSLEDIADLLSYSPTPEEMLIFGEELKTINDFVEKNFSKSEKKVFKLNLVGLSYLEIAEILDCDEKFVDNALQRVRKKLRKLKL